MEIYFITIKSKDNKSKTVLCETDIDLLKNIKAATESELTYTVYKGTEIMSIADK